MSSASQAESFDLSTAPNRSGTGVVKFCNLMFRESSSEAGTDIPCGASVVIEIAMENHAQQPLRQMQIALGIDDYLGQRVTVLASNYSGQDFQVDSTGRFQVTVQIPRLGLMPGRYTVTLFASIGGEVADWIKRAGHFDVLASDFFGTGRFPGAGEAMFLVDHHFKINSSISLTNLMNRAHDR
jgi:lipopolysaccharide transport system ATP-binding protein